MFVAVLVCGALAAGLSAGSSEAALKASRSALVRGDVQVCGSPCWVSGVGYCTSSQGCVKADRVAAIDAEERRVATVRLHHARFKLDLVPGRYTLELLGDGRREHGHVMQRKTVRAPADRTTHVHFRFDVY